ncbi:GNAT family N-acetyltransferase [Vitreoscilla massiliensis]|uniref:GNAT family N-acetyltransferase n=1 Tax=Vitreoscilla massiliensis TaxID=1689272 RepID=A0ABY4E755_9NEIS|nr:GNAT family N-acetyltransferase [Vitreoscilla massiliensis]UOO90720.1 GNAT family N-acetyltransferase [Vitreoscilla massiliensis]
MIKRTATSADLPQLSALEAACNPHPWSSRQLEASLKQDSVDVIEHEGQIVSMLVSKSLFDEAEIYLVDTLAAFRRMGLAKQLIHGLQAANERIFLEVRQSNVAAQHVYAALGFRQIAVRRAYYVCDEGREDALILEWSR